MNIKLTNRFAGLAERVLIHSKAAPKYVVELRRKPHSSSHRGEQLGSYLRYVTNIERKL